MRRAPPMRLAPPARSGVVVLAAGVTLGLLALGVGSRLLRLLAMTLAGLTFLLCTGLSSPPLLSLSSPPRTALCLFALTGVARRGVLLLAAGVVGLAGRWCLADPCRALGGGGESTDERLSGLLMGMLDCAEMVRSKRSGVPMRSATESDFKADFAGVSRSFTSELHRGLADGRSVCGILECRVGVLAPALDGVKSRRFKGALGTLYEGPAGPRLMLEKRRLSGANEDRGVAKPDCRDWADGLRLL